MTTEGSRYSIAVLNRALDILETLEQTAEPVGASEIARHIGATKTATFRILNNLELRRYVAKDPNTTRYTLGPRLAVIGGQAFNGLDLRHLAHPHLESLHRRFEETANLGILDGDHIVYIDMVERTHGLRMAAQTGSRHPAHSTALGKAMLAFLPDAELNHLYDSDLHPQTPRTITDRETLMASLQGVRLSQVAEDLGENEAGARCIGVAIFDHLARPTAALSISGPESRIDNARSAEIGAALKRAAQEITRAIGGTWPTIDETADQTGA